MVDKVFSVYDLHDENLLLQKATIKAEISVLLEEKTQLENKLQETINIVAVEMQSLQKEIDATHGQILLNNNAIADSEDEKTRLTSEIEPLRYKKNQIQSEITKLEEQHLNTVNAHENERDSYVSRIQELKETLENTETQFDSLIGVKTTELQKILVELAEKQVFIEKLIKYEKVSNARFIQEVQKLLDKRGIKLDVFKEVQKHIK